MARHVRRVAGVASRMALRIVRIAHGAITLVLPVVLVAGLALVRAGGISAGSASGPALNAGAQQSGLSARAQLDRGATQMTASLSSGFDFTVVARSTLYAKPDGPKIEVPDPADPYTVAGVADSYDLGATAAIGTVKGEDFFLQLYDGPTDPGKPVDLATLAPSLAALVRDGHTWRNDGDGWYVTDQPPGIGLDPRTAALLPAMLRNTTAAKDAPATLLAGQQLPTVAAAAAVADAPGLMAIDAAPFTVFAQPLSFAFDASGRLAQLTATMRNTRMADFDLIVVTTITFDYDHLSAFPDASPTAPPPPTLAPDPIGAVGQPEASR